jgi:plastocyanin
MGKKLLMVLIALLSVGLVAFAAGCGDDDDDSDSAATTSEETTADNGGEPSQIVMTEYEFEPNAFTVPTGNTLTLSNDGQVPHNMAIVEGEPTGGGAEIAASDDIAPGKSGGLTIDAEPGEYGFLCTIPGHAEDGMVGTVTIE